MAEPKITIITVVYNGEDLIEDTILSVINQKNIALEYIIIDGKSTDGTIQIINKYLGKIDIFISESDFGISDAFNKALKLATGKYVNILNAGDIFANDETLSKIKPQLNCDVVSFSHSPYNKRHKISRFIDANGSIIEKALINHQATFVSKDVYDRFGGYNISFKIRMDYDFFLRILSKSKLKYVHEIIVHYNAGLSGDLKNQVRYESEGIIAEYLNLRKPNIYLLKMLYRPFFRFSLFLLLFIRNQFRRQL